MVKELNCSRIVRKRTVAIDLEDLASVNTEKTEATTFSDEFSLENIKTIPRKVSFALESNGEVRQSTRIVERHEDPSLWWTRTEMTNMRKNNLLLAYSKRKHKDDFARATLSFVEEGTRETWNEMMKQSAALSDMRGLEHYFIPKCQEMACEVVERVLEMQCQTKNPNALRHISRAWSRSSSRLARQRARHDAKEARRDSL